MTITQFNQYPILTPCRVVSTTNVSGTYSNGPLNNGVGATLTIAASSLTIDSVVVAVGDRVLLVGQSSANQNGIYIVNTISSTVVLQRSADFQSLEQILVGQSVSVAAGTVKAGAVYTVIEPKPNYLGINNLVFNGAITSGLGTAATKAASDNAESNLASVDTPVVVGNIATYKDTSGTIQDSGYNVDNLLQYASVAVSASDFNGMYASPKLLVAAPGANKAIVVDRVELVMTFNSTQYAAGGVVGVQYDSTANGAGTKATNTQQASDFTGAAASTIFVMSGASGNSSQATFTAAVNKGLYLSNQTAAFTTGNSAFVAKIHYRIIATA